MARSLGFVRRRLAGAMPLGNLLKGHRPPGWLCGEGISYAGDTASCAASLQTLIGAAVSGLAAVRRDARGNLSTHRLLHTLTQARLASIGMYTGAEVALEPGKSGGPGDVLLRWSGHEAFLEVVTFGPDENSEVEDKHHHQHFLHLLSLRPAEPIYWKVTFLAC
jgi:hypothetical protein